MEGEKEGGRGRGRGRRRGRKEREREREDIYVLLLKWLTDYFLHETGRKVHIVPVLLISFVPQVPAGLFIPSMFVGACMGRVVGIGMEQLA